MKLKLISTSIPYGPVPDADTEVEQHLVITGEGRVELTSYIYGTTCGYEKNNSIQLYTSQETATLILLQIEKYFSKGYDVPHVPDSGIWSLEITGAGDETLSFAGSFHLADETLCKISDSIRNLLNMPNLFLFDGRTRQRRITGIILRYRRIRTASEETGQAEGETGKGTFEDTECFILSREHGSLEHIVESSEGYHTEQKIKSGKMISRLLDVLSEIPFWENVEGNPPDTIFDLHESREYSLTIDFEDGESRILKGTFDRNGLPKKFPEMARYLWAYLTYCTESEILDPSIFTKVYRKRSEYIFCNVVFNGWGKTYCYLTDDDEIEEGDYVVVPAGKDNRETIVLVDSVEYYPPEEAPFPLDKIKRVIRKCTKEEIEKME